MRTIRPGLALLTACLTLSAADGPTFDAASVKVAGPDVKLPYSLAGGPGTNDPGMFRASHISMGALLARAFDTDQLVIPSWIRSVSNFYSVLATMPPDTTKEQFQRMLQNLLIERFHLVFHHETQNFSAFDLVVDKGGPKLKEVTPNQTPNSGNATRNSASLSDLDGSDGFPKISGPQTMGRGDANGVRHTKYQERTIAEFVSNLGSLIGTSQGRAAMDGYPQPRVVDKTGLTGRYTFILEYYDGSMQSLRALVGANDGQGPDVIDDPGSGPTIFAAIKNQLGLRLDKTADVPTEVIVVENLDKLPTPN